MHGIVHFQQGCLPNSPVFRGCRHLHSRDRCLQPGFAVVPSAFESKSKRSKTPACQRYTTRAPKQAGLSTLLLRIQSPTSSMQGWRMKRDLDSRFSRPRNATRAPWIHNSSGCPSPSRQEGGIALQASTSQKRNFEADGRTSCPTCRSSLRTAAPRPEQGFFHILADEDGFKLVPASASGPRFIPTAAC